MALGPAGLDRAGTVAEHEREALARDFVRLCEIESPSGDERAIADHLAGELSALGIAVEEDASAAETGAGSGNLFASLPGRDRAAPILLCAHLDTVPLAAPVTVIERDGWFENANDAILGADNKAALAVILALVRRAVAEPLAASLELLFTTCEERALRGAKAFDAARLRARLGFVFDHASPIGELVVAAPSYFRIAARVRGQPAHAGIRPERGRNAIAAAAAALARLEFGRLDDRTTANVGSIEGGAAANVVAERCDVELEARSLDHDRASEVAIGIVDAFTLAANEHECDVETVVEELFRAYRLSRTAPVVEVAARALEACGIEPAYITTGGGSDASALIAAGIPCVNVANGTERNHQPDERVSRAALERMLEVALAIVDASA